MPPQQRVAYGLNMSAWKELAEQEEDAAWAAFCQRFKFRQGVQPSDWPGILEPVQSVTYDIGHAFAEGPVAYRRITNDLGAKLIDALRRCVSPGATIFALDWQHPCYSFEPHGDFKFEGEGDWPVHPLPNGDYYIFVARDMEFGVFGHPWEGTMCLFGQRLIDAFAANPPELFSRKIRAGGHAVGKR